MKSEFVERNRFVVAQERQHAMAVASHGGTLGHLTVEATQFAGRAAHRVADWLHAHHVISGSEAIAVEVSAATNEDLPLATVTPISAARSYQGSTAAFADAPAVAAERGE